MPTVKIRKLNGRPTEADGNTTRAHHSQVCTDASDDLPLVHSVLYQAAAKQLLRYGKQGLGLCQGEKQMPPGPEVGRGESTTLQAGMCKPLGMRLWHWAGRRGHR